MRKLIFSSIVLLLILFSCTKKPVQTEETCMPLSTGSYWVYDVYIVDSTGNETKTDYSDSIIITKDTLIREYNYAVFEGIRYPTLGWRTLMILRDSSGYLVNERGDILYSASNFTDTLHTAYTATSEDTLLITTYQMVKTTESLAVPAGSFVVTDYFGTVYSTAPVEGITYPRYLHNYYSEGTGKVFYSLFYMHSPDVLEMRLTRYHIETESLE